MIFITPVSDCPGFLSTLLSYVYGCQCQFGLSSIHACINPLLYDIPQWTLAYMHVSTLFYMIYLSGLSSLHTCINLLLYDIPQWTVFGHLFYSFLVFCFFRPHIPLLNIVSVFQNSLSPSMTGIFSTCILYQNIIIFNHFL